MNTVSTSVENETVSKPLAVILILHIRDRANRVMYIRDTIEGPWHLPGMYLESGTAIDDTLPTIAATKLGFTLSPRDCRMKLVHEEITDTEHRVYIVYQYRLLREILMDAWGDTQEMTLSDHIPAGTTAVDTAILQKLV